MSEKRRVAITGLGVVSPLGVGKEENWSGIVGGRSGIGRITAFDPADYPAQIAGEAKNFNPAAYLSDKEIRRTDRFIHLGVAAGVEAIKDSGIEITEANAERIGVYMGSGFGGINTVEQTTLTLNQKGPRRVSPFYVPASIINMISGVLSIKFGLKGPNLAIVTACSTATHSIGDAGRLIEYGDADVMVAGGAEAAVTPTGIAGFSNAKSLSTRNDDPAGASRPWDVERDGFVLSEGGAAVVLEEMESAKRRSARIYAELIGFGMAGDAYHITSPPDGGEGAARCMRLALHNARIEPDAVQYVNAHGTSTDVGDIAETWAIKSAFGDHAHRLAVSSTKSMTGHLLGAAGGVEAIYSALSIYHQIAPPTINLVNPGPQCDLDYVPGSAREMKIDVAISNSFGFGGTNGTLVLRRMS